MSKLLLILLFLLFTTFTTFAQFYIGPYVGFKTSGLKGATRTTQGGQVTTGTVADAGSTGFTAGFTAGYQVLPSGVAGNLYKLDIALDASWSHFSYFENGWNSANGAGSFSGDGLSGGGTNVFSFDIMPIHRFNFGNFILSPYAGLGLGINLMFTSDITVGPPQNFNGTITGTSQTKLGLLVFYGTLFNVSSLIKPYVQFKHLIPFGSETQFTESLQVAQGGGTQSYASAIEDVPGYFSITAGVRFEF